MAITVTVQGVEKLITDLAKLTPAIERSVILRMSQVAYDSAQAGAGRHSKTGALFRSLYNRSIPKGREVGHDPQMAPHALFVNFGTRPHKIYPKKKKLLRWAANGRWYSKHEVNHPGYLGDNYMQRAADESIRQFRAIVDAATKEQS